MVAPNRRDVVIAFGGRVDPSLAAARRQSEREIVGLRDRLGKKGSAVLMGAGQGLGGRFGTGISAGLAGGVGGIAAFAAGSLVPALLKATGATEALAKAFGFVTEQARQTASAMKGISDSFRTQTHKLIQGEVGPAREASEKAFSRFSLPGGFPASLFGERSGQLRESLNAIQASRDKIARERADPTVFGQLRSRFMRQINESRGVTGGDRAQGASEALASLFGFGDTARRAGRARQQDIIADIRRQAGERALREVRGRDTSLGLADAELLKQQNRIRGLMGLEMGFGNAIAGGRRAGGILGTIGGAFGRAGGVFSQAFGGISESFAMNRAMRLQTENPAETLMRELGNLEAMRGQGLNEEQFRRRRRQLRMGAIASLPGAQQTPSLAATEGRFITMGRRSPEADELSALRRELKMHTEKQTSALVAAIRESGGESDSL